MYYWIPSYLQQVLHYTKKDAADIMSLGSIGGIVGSILMGTISDLLIVRSPVHTVGCALGAISLLLLVSVQTDTHTAFLTGCMTSFFLFENGATIIIAIVLCDIGKDELLRRKRRAVATISGINDGIAGFGSILGQLLLGPISFLYGWKGVFVMFTGAALIACFPTVPYLIKEI